MNTKNAFPATNAVVVLTCGIATTTFAHYAEVWIIGYGLSVLFALAAMFIGNLATD